MKKITLLFILLIAIILSACKPGVEGDVLRPSATSVVMQSTADPTQTPGPVVTAEPEKVLTICTAALPLSLFPYDGVQTPIKENILSLLVEDGFDLVEGALVPNILEKTPSEADGAIRLEPIEVRRGQTIVDANGELVVLKAGVVVRPSGCRSADCVITWDGENQLTMDQMVVEFVINESVTWSDGTRVTAGDSVFSFTVAQDPERPGLKWAEDRTEEYLAVDQRLVRWTGKPGFSTSKIDAFFWSPLPSHLFSGLETWSELSAAENLSRSLLSYGPFNLVDWVEGGIQLTPNPYYYRAVDGLPALDRVIIKALAGGGAEAVGAIQSGMCDVLDTSFKLEDNAEVLSAVQQDEELNLHLGQSQSWTQLVFGIQPASYDVFYNPIYGDRPDFFGDPRTRQAIAACLDMNAILAAGTQGLGQMRSSFTAPGYSQLSSLESINFDPTFGMNLLGELGWVNHDDSPETPLQAWSVSNVPNGTTFVVELLTSQSPYHLSLGEAIVQSLGACGIGVDVQSMPSPDLYAPGPDGRLFGRSFDLALIAWQPEPELDCKFYLSNKIPNNENAWVGTNIAGFNRQMYDSVCATAALALPGEYASALYEAELTYLDALPAVPLISAPQMMVTAGNICLNEEAFDREAELFRLLKEIKVNCP